MKAWTIAIFTFIFMMSLNLLYTLDVFGTGLSVTGSWSEDEFITSYGSLNSSLSGQLSTVAGNSPTGFFETVGMLVAGATAFIGAVVKSTVLAPETFNWLLVGMGMSSADARLISVPIGTLVLVVYVVGIIQLWMGRNLPEME